MVTLCELLGAYGGGPLGRCGASRQACSVRDVREQTLDPRGRAVADSRSHREVEPVRLDRGEGLTRDVARIERLRGGGAATR